MSLNDGQLKQVGEIQAYVTSDLALAAYLLERGYELLGAIDTGRTRKEWGLTHTDKSVLTDMLKDITVKADEFENIFLQVPGDQLSRVNFRSYYRKIKDLHHALDEAIRKERA